MPLQHERERCARDRHTGTKLIAIADEIRIVKLFGEAATSVAADVPPEQAGPLRALLILTADRLTTIAITLEQESQTDAA